ncbi:GAF domain-containing protein [Salarchaeum sp. JOR-1]|uniref:GAF domain-containing protein n=1 Tax=Salarchaeum sp. JOR-1 TaxID=2599399 RepID=UPI002102F898
MTPTAYSAQVETLIGEPPTLPPGNSLAWRVYTNQEAATFDDVRTAEDVYNPTTPFRSELIYPLGNHGVLLIGDTEIGAFDRDTEELADLLATAAETALDRVAWAQQLQTQKQDAQRQAQQLTRANQINEKLRESIQAIIEADTRQEIEQAICTHLTEIDRFAFAWVGKPTPTGDAVTPVAWAGSNSEYIEDLSGHLDIDSHLPAVQTIREREPTNVSTVADAANQEPWRQLALLHEYQSAISVPIIYDETLYGALTIYATRPSAFDERSTAVLQPRVLRSGHTGTRERGISAMRRLASG